ncbi:MAG: hypothetical protein RLZZ519_2377 [Bacteroidota bacterium]|jgi:hypothetical protein
MTKSIQLGNIIIAEPCTVPWENMDNAENGNKFCQQCQKSVVDFSQMTEKQIEALLKSRKGEVCGSFLLDAEGKPIVANPKPCKPTYFRHLAATAALLLLQQSAHSTPDAEDSKIEIVPSDPDKTKSAPSPKTNTLVTGVIINTDGDLIPKDVDVRIYLNGERIAIVKSQHGLFAVDLKGIANPEDQIEIVIWKENFSDKDFHDGKTIRTTVAAAQNLKMRISYTLIYPRRGGGRTLYINNI